MDQTRLTEVANVFVIQDIMYLENHAVLVQKEQTITLLHNNAIQSADLTKYITDKYVYAQKNM